MTQRWQKISAALLASAAGALLIGAASIDQQEMQEPQPTKASWLNPPGDATRGEKLSAICMSCHAANSPPTSPPAPKLHRQRMSYMFFALRDFRDGRRESPIMGPVVKNFSDRDLRDIATFMAGDMLDKPPRPNPKDPFYPRSHRTCTWCHGETGIGELEGMPVIAGQDPAYLENALEEYRKGIRHDPTMRQIAGTITPEEEKGLAAYYGSYQWLEKSQ